MKLRQPSAGNERIRPEQMRTIIKNASEMLSTLDDEGVRALAWAREHDGYAASAATDPTRGSDVGDRTGNSVAGRASDHGIEIRKDVMPTMYELMVHAILELDMASKILAGLLNTARVSALTDDEEHKLERANATIGICDACGRYHDPTRGDRDDKLKPGGNERMYGPDCYSAWQRNLQAANPATRQVFERMRGKGVQPTTEDVA